MDTRHSPSTRTTPWMIAGGKPDTHLTDLQHPWRRIRVRAGLDDVRIHDLRHSLASRASVLGEGLPMIEKLPWPHPGPDHRTLALFARDTVKASAACIGDSIERDLNTVE